MLQNNFVSSLTGIISSKPIIVNAPDTCLSFTILIKRSSGYSDSVEILIPKSAPCFNDKWENGEAIRVIGFVYTYQNNFAEYPKTRICIYATSVVKTNYPTNKNIIICQGTIVKLPRLRQTPTGIIICDVLLAVNNEINGLCASYIPLVAWNQRAYDISDCKVGTKLYIIGRLESREYNKTINNETKTYLAHELSVNSYRIIGD